MNKYLRILTPITLVILAFFTSKVAVFAADLEGEHWKNFNLGVQAEKKLDYEKAIFYFARALALKDRDASTLIKLASIYIETSPFKGELESDYLLKAIDYLAKAESITPSDALIQVLMAQSYHTLGDNESAITHYQKAVTLEPNNDLLKLNLGLVFYETKDYKQAIELLNKVVLAYPDNLKARSYLGAALQSTDNYLAAIEQYNYVLTYEKDNFSIIKNVGDSWLALEQFSRAKESFRQAQELDPLVPELYADLAYIDQKQQNFAQSIDNYKKALELKPENPAWRKTLAYTYWANDKLEDAVWQFNLVEEYDIAGFLYQKLGNNDEAIKTYLKAIDANPQDTKSRYNLGRLYHETKEYDLAKEQYLKIIELKPNDSETLYLLGVAEQEEGAMAEAIKYYNELLEKQEAKDDDKSESGVVVANIYFNLGLAYKIQNDLVKAEDHFTKALDEGYAVKDDLFRELSTVKILQGKAEEAETIIKDWLKNDPTNVLARNLYADLLISMGKERRAIEELRLASVLDKTNETRLKLANLLHSQNNYYDALAEYQIILKEEPKNLNALMGAANNFRSLKFKDEAINLYSQAVEVNPRDLLANYNLGLALQESNELDKALEQYNRVADINPEFSENYYSMGLCYWDLDDKKQAVDTWNKFLSISPNEDLKREIVKIINDYKVSLQRQKQLKKQNQGTTNKSKRDVLKNESITRNDEITG